MARPETGLWDFLRVRMPVGGHYSRIESQDTAPGFPDVHFTLKGHTGGMELKCNEFPVGDFPFKDKTGLRRSQIIWVEDEIHCGGRVILCLQYKTEIHFLDGRHARALERMRIENIRHHAMLSWDRTGECDVPALATLMTEYEYP